MSIDADPTRTCARCRQAFPTSLFPRKRGTDRGAGKPGSYCPECQAQVSREHAKRAFDKCSQDPDCVARRTRTNRKATLKRYFGITPEQYQLLLDFQLGGCAICGATEPGPGGRQHLPVDHDHGTGKIRGILCEGCNVGLGHFGDDPTRLRAAADYIERSRE